MEPRPPTPLHGYGDDTLVQICGPLVKRSRHRPLTPVTRVRFPHGSPKAGVYYVEDPPVPIPNTVVKLNSADNTWRVTAWEDRSMPALYSSILSKSTSLRCAIGGLSPPVGLLTEHSCFGYDAALNGAPSGTRTRDPLIKSQLLYQLS